ncbi:hypothetical protein HOT72_gp074 [Gordonia phage Apricot]|uniref:Uncharacterized protein n=1 Tax=Gordonia phage Apricot TaxID=2250319 RepID=A0A345L181_9CAUD|nr:hypothetical protein HOT72_gp074 [Gordonia phage Apricot]AXH49033.1 hypothetical protein SEA_APRICOT_74 [Gordonia phage Apricot]
MPSDTPTPVAILAAHDYIAGVSSCPCGWHWTETRTYACGEDLRIARAYNDHLIAALAEHYHLLPKVEHNDSFEGNDDEHGWRSWSLPGGGINVFDDGAISMEVRYAYGVDPTGVRVIASALASAADVAEEPK